MPKIKSAWSYFQWAINAYIAFLLQPFFRDKQPVWLIGGLGGELYADNAKAFYEYLLTNHPEIRAIWVARKGSAAQQLAKGEVVVKGSVKNYVLFFNSQVTLFSDTLNHDIAPLAFGLPGPRYFYFKVLKVRLNHGTVAFKKRVGKSGISGRISEAIIRSYDLNTASTLLEQSVFEGYTKAGSVVLTGSARNDTIDAALPTAQTILIAPTWRPWLRGTPRFNDSEFFMAYRDLLLDKRLNQLLERTGLKVKFHLHHMMREHLSAFLPFASKHIKTLDANASVANELVRCALLVTDYSSLCAERYILKRPVLFFHFDRDKYSKQVGSYIDLDKDHFGEVAPDVEGLVTLLEQTIKNNYKISARQAAGEKYFVHFKDKQNCSRIYTEVQRRLGK